MSTTPVNKSRLLEIMDKHKLSASQVSCLVHKSVHTVNQYRAKTRPHVPTYVIELLQYKLNDPSITLD